MNDDERTLAYRRSLQDVMERIGRVERRWTHEVVVVPVTKGFGDDTLELVAAAGGTAVGENYAQEILAKRATIERLGLSVHFIGRLQSNKIRQLTDVVTIWSTIDRPSVVDELAKRRAGARVRIQVNTTDEPQKGGCAPDDVEELLGRASGAGLVVEGLMTVGPTDAGPEAARPGFATLRALVDRFGLTVCSMGMTADLEVAVQEGSSEVRVGTALFGERPARP